jgi:hypothetical protein
MLIAVNDHDDAYQESVRVINSLARMAEPWALRVAATLRIADLVAAGHRTLTELATRAYVDRDSLGRLLRFLCARGVFTETAPGIFGLTGPAELLRDDHPGGTRQWLDLSGAGGAMESVYAGLLDSVRTGTPAYPSLAGRSFWEDMVADPALSESFASLMEARSAGVADDMAHRYPWSNVRSLVDVGGGTGKVLARILAAHPHLRGILFDRIASSPATMELFRQAGLEDRCTNVTGDFFGELPAGADVYMLHSVVHDWPDPEAAVILRRCAVAAGSKGRVLLVEFIVSEGVNDYEVTAMDLRMLLLFGGKERTMKQFSELADGAGLRIREAQPTVSPYWLIECVSKADSSHCNRVLPCGGY